MDLSVEECYFAARASIEAIIEAFKISGDRPHLLIRQAKRLRDECRAVILIWDGVTITEEGADDYGDREGAVDGREGVEPDGGRGEGAG